MKKLISIIFLVNALGFIVSAQRKIIHLPDLPGFVTIKADLHLHTVFSDGNVWPTVRIDEALRDGLDAVAITDHLEYTPKDDFLPADFNAAWKIGEAYARDRNFILIHGAEITRSMPPGHFNALFIQDANALAVDSAWDALAEAARQGAFIQWNHPGWKSQQPDGIPRMYEIHSRLIKNGWLQGIEFFNDSEYYPLVMTFARQFNLAVEANSDNHGVISEDYPASTNINRPMTLIFAKEKTSEAIKEALFARRTLAYFHNTIAGMDEYARPFFWQCISVGKPYYQNDKSIFFEVTNTSDIPFYLVNGSAPAPSSIYLAPDAVTRVVISKKVKAPLVYNVRNVITGENEVLKVELKLSQVP